jgi:hypothetical protein
MARRNDDNGNNPIDLVIALDSFEIGEHRSIRGHIHRTGDPIVQARPEAFITFFSTTAERERAHMALLEKERRRAGLP